MMAHTPGSSVARHVKLVPGTAGVQLFNDGMISGTVFGAKKVVYKLQPVLPRATHLAATAAGRMPHRLLPIGEAPSPARVPSPSWSCVYCVKRENEGRMEPVRLLFVRITVVRLPAVQVRPLNVV